MFVSNGILFNHESERRGETFVTRKITQAVWLILQHREPDDFVIATGKAHSVQEFVEEAFGLVGLEGFEGGMEGAWLRTAGQGLGKAAGNLSVGS